MVYTAITFRFGVFNPLARWLLPPYTRTVIQQDEWLLYLHGAVLGLAGGFAHLAVFG